MFLELSKHIAGQQMYFIYFNTSRLCITSCYKRVILLVSLGTLSFISPDT